MEPCKETHPQGSQALTDYCRDIDIILEAAKSGVKCLIHGCRCLIFKAAYLVVISLHALRGAQAHPYGAGSQFQANGTNQRNFYAVFQKIPLIGAVGLERPTNMGPCKETAPQGAKVLPESQILRPE